LTYRELSFNDSTTTLKKELKVLGYYDYLLKAGVDGDTGVKKGIMVVDEVV